MGSGVDLENQKSIFGKQKQKNKMNPLKQKGLLIKKIIYPKYQIAKYAVILIKRIS